MGNMDEKWFNLYNEATVSQEKLRIKAEQIKNDKTIDPTQAELELNLIQARFDQLQSLREDMLKLEN